MSVFNFITLRAKLANRDLIETKFHRLAETAMANVNNAEQDAKMAEGLCFADSPSQCLVLQFSAPLLVHPHVLLATLDIRDSFLFDTSKFAVK